MGVSLYFSQQACVQGSFALMFVHIDIENCLIISSRIEMSGINTRRNTTKLSGSVTVYGELSRIRH
jgi:hypothetical protein